MLYQAGYFARRIMVEAEMTLPEGWRFGSALEVASKSGDQDPLQAGAA